MKFVYPAIFIPDDSDVECYTVEIPDLPGCVSEGHGLQEAIEMGTEAACGWILGELEEGKAIPSPSSVSEIDPHEPGSFVSLLVLDIDSYSDKYRKNY